MSSSPLRIAYPTASSAPKTVFGLTPAIRLARQWQRLKQPRSGWTLVIGDDVVIDTPSLGWLTAQSSLVVVDAAGRPLVAWLDDAEAAAVRDWFAGGIAFHAPSVRIVRIDTLEFFAGALKKREAFLAFSLTDTPSRVVEDKFYFASFKGVTDVVTKYVWPRPALVIVRGCVALGITPNMVTMVSILLSIAAIPLFLAGHLIAGLAAAWGMTFLDTVDGKLARTTVTYTNFGNYFDHIPDILFPPIWWWAFMAGLPVVAPEVDTGLMWTCFWLILASYLVGRGCEGLFDLRNKFGPFLWRRFDARFRLVLARRNPNLLILTTATLIGQPVTGYLVLTAWCLICAGLQLVALAQSEASRRHGPLRSFLDAGSTATTPANG